MVLKDLIDCRRCKVTIDYYVPFTINIESEEKYISKHYWRTGNFKNSLLEIGLDKISGVVLDITLTSVNNVVFLNSRLESCYDAESGTPVFFFEGSVANGICDYLKDFTVYLGLDFIMVALEENSKVFKKVETGRVRFEFDDNNNLISITIKELTEFEYSELLEGLKV